MNHLAKGSSHSHTVSQSLVHDTRSAAWRAQKPS